MLARDTHSRFDVLLKGFGRSVRVSPMTHKYHSRISVSVLFGIAFYVLISSYVTFVISHASEIKREKEFVIVESPGVSFIGVVTTTTRGGGT